MARTDASADLAIGVAVAGARLGRAAARVALTPVRMALRAPFVGPPLRRRADELAHDGQLARARALARV